MKFHENPSSGSDCDTCEQRDGDDGGRSRFSRQFCEGSKNERNIPNFLYTEDRGIFLRKVGIYASHIAEHHYLNIDCGENFNFQNVSGNLYTPPVSIYRVGYKLGDPGFETGSGKRFISSPKRPVLVNGTTFPRQSCRGVRLTTHLHLVSRLKISGAVLLLLPHAFMAPIRTTLHLLYIQQYSLFSPV